MASKIDLRDGKILIADKHGEIGRLSKADVILARDEKDIQAKLTVRSSGEQVYYFHYDTLGGGWECISGPRGLPRPQAGDWPSAARQVRSG